MKAKKQTIIGFNAGLYPKTIHIKPQHHTSYLLDYIPYLNITLTTQDLQNLETYAVR
jgi:hypothetical protein